MSMMDAVRHVFRNYAAFTGRARRSEYWYFVLFNILISMAAAALSIILAVTAAASSSGGEFAFVLSSIISSLMGIYGLACIIPALALCCRRLHDIGKPGSYLLFALLPIAGSILMLVWFLQEGDPVANRYGPNPKACRGGAAPVPPAFPTQPVFGGVQETAPPNRMPGMFMVQGVSGALAGRQVPVNGRVAVGRGSECAVRFPEGTGGVSRLHCELAVNGGNLYIRDLGSTYGTYVNGNIRLSPNQVMAVRPGDRIFIGSGSQVLTVVRS